MAVLCDLCRSRRDCGKLPYKNTSLACLYAGELPAGCGDLGSGPLAEEAVFRSGIYGFLRPRLGTRASAFCSALAFGLYHGNWIQGIYGFMMGILLAWGYERSRYRKYAVVVLMHGAANLAALAVFG